MRFHAAQHFLRLKRLGNVVNAADGKRLHFIKRVIERADENDGDVAGLRMRF